MHGNFFADSRITDDAREDEMEENLQQVDSMVSNLRNMAVDMGNELQAQTAAIDNINQKVRNLFIRPIKMVLVSLRLRN